MKKLLLLLFVLGIFLLSCTPSEMALYRKDRATRWTGLDRVYRIYSVDGKLLETFSGVSYIQDGAESGDITIVMLHGAIKKIDILGPAILVAEEIPAR